jgi:hypothetical protein
MTDPPDKEPPLQVPVTAAWLAEQTRKRAAYEARRARWVEAWSRGGQPEPPTETGSGPKRSRTIYDKRQFRFDV